VGNYKRTGQGRHFSGPDAVRVAFMRFVMRKKTDVLVHPSLEEALSMSVQLEAMTLKKPVIAGIRTPGTGTGAG
jgi:hypothetical protein